MVSAKCDESQSRVIPHAEPRKEKEHSGEDIKMMHCHPAFAREGREWAAEWKSVRIIGR